MKALLITSSYPPDASAGSIRWAGFAEHLKRRGVELSVVREVRRPFPKLAKWKSLGSAEADFSESDGSRQLISEKLNRFERMLKPVIHVISRIFVPIDHQLLSVPRLIREANRAIQKQRPDVLISTSLPLYTAVGAARIKKRTGLPLVVELRDPWCTNPLKIWPTRLHYWIEKRIEKFVLNSANLIVMNTETAREHLLKARPWLAPDKVVALPHSFDQDRFSQSDQSPANGKFRIGCGAGYYGSCLDENRGGRQSLFFRYRLVPESEIDKQHSSPRLLFDAIAELFNEHPHYRESVELRFMGQLNPADLEYANRVGLVDSIYQSGRLHPGEVPSFLKSCDLLYLTNPVFRSLRSPFVATKTVEYMAARRPVLVVLGKSENRSMIEQSGMGISCDPFDFNSIKTELQNFIERTPSKSLKPNEPYIRQFSRAMQTEKLENMLNQAINSASKPTAS